MLVICNQAVGLGMDWPVENHEQRGPKGSILGSKEPIKKWNTSCYLLSRMYQDVSAANALVDRNASRERERGR
jgi:hypothetical protein